MLHGAYTARECLRARVLDVLEIQLVPVLFGQGVHGAGAAQALLRAGLLDEMEIHLVPVLLGGGDICSTRLAPTTSNSNWSGDWRRAT
jgi:dihydrofolate reductase